MTGNNIDVGVGTDTVKFTAATNADTVTVTSTTIAGAKSLTFEAAATATVSLRVPVLTWSSLRTWSPEVASFPRTLVMTQFSS